MEQVDLTDLVSNVMASFSTQMKQKQQKTEINLPEQSTQITGNSTMLRQLFNNLIDNAVKYTDEKGKISIDITRKNSEAFVAIQDTGIGIDDIEQTKIFDRFYRVDASRSQTKGYGLGLAICRTIVDIHHGQLTVRSKKHSGTTFIVSLPIYANPGKKSTLI